MSTQEKAETSPEVQLEAQAQGAKRLYASGTFSDLVITCRGQEWKVHKFQVCTQSDFFYKMCTGDFKEAKEGKINLDNDEPEAVEAMLHYMYHGSYVDPGNAPQDIAPILLDVRMFIIADKYFIKPLKSVTRAKFAQHCADEWKSADFALAIREIYATELSDTSVKDIAIKTIREHTGEFFTDRDTYEGIHKAMRDIPAFGADVLGELAATKYDFGNLLKWKLKCPNCQSDFYVGVPAANSNFRFSCPKGDNINQTISWWSSYRIQ